MMKFNNCHVNKYLENNKLSIIDSDVNRPWGSWYLIHNNSLSDKKILQVLPQNILSLQYHGTDTNLGHNEIWEACTPIRAVLSFESAINKSQCELIEILNNLIIVDVECGGKINIGAGFIHALANPYLEDIYVIEERCSQKPETSQDRENNITRIYDQKQRNNTPSYPIALLNKILDPKYKPNYSINCDETFTFQSFMETPY